MEPQPLQLTLFDGICPTCHQPVKWIYPSWLGQIRCTRCLNQYQHDQKYRGE